MSLNYNRAHHSTFKKIWDNLNLNEKQKYIKQAKLENVIMNKNLYWSEIESNFQSKLRDVIKQ